MLEQLSRRRQAREVRTEVSQEIADPDEQDRRAGFHNNAAEELFSTALDNAR